MDFNERQGFIHRIASGKLYGQVSYQGELHSVVFSDPSLQISTQADWIYKKFYEDSKDRGSLTIEETYSILIQDGKWDDKKEKEMKTIKSDIEVLQKQLVAAKYKKTLQRAIKETISNGQERLKELYLEKNQLASSTIEHLSEIARQNFIISKITLILNPNTDLIDNARFRETLRVYYFEENSISESQIRELARSDPWRLYWTASKDTGTPLFPHSAVEFTDNQYLLVLWSKLYDYAYESSNRPTNDVVEDDSRFDAWYKEEMEKRTKEIQKNSVTDDGCGNEIFIPADAEGAKEVYELNDTQGRSTIISRQKFIKDKGIVKEADLPDVRQDLIMQANRSVSK